MHLEFTPQGKKDDYFQEQIPPTQKKVKPQS
jgi:hypothetical protein